MIYVYAMALKLGYITEERVIQDESKEYLEEVLKIMDNLDL